MARLPVRATLIALAAGAGLAGCTDYYDDYGYGPGYNYSAVSVGYGNGYYYPSSRYGTRYSGYPYYGWYNNYYYPGVGVYVYDVNRRPYRWNDGQRSYWEGRREYRDGRQYSENWSDFRRDRRGDGRRGDRRRWRRGR